MNTTKPAPRVAVFLPIGYRGGTFRLVLNVVRHFATVQSVPVVFGIPEDHLPVVADELAVLLQEQPTVEVRSFSWEQIGRRRAESVIQEAGLVVEQFISEAYQVPVDKAGSFLDCDFWFFVSDRILYPLVPLRPYGILVTDHLQRYVPEIFDLPMYANQAGAPWNFNRNVRNADIAVATSEGTFRDVQSYSGCLGTRLKIPTTIDLDYFLQLVELAADAKPSSSSRPYCIWVTNSSQHKNHLEMIHAIRTFYESLAGDLDIVVTGFGADLFDPELPKEQLGRRRPLWEHPYVRKVREQVREQLGPWKERLHWKGLLEERDYVAAVKNSRFLIHNVLADNGTFSVVEAAILGRPAISSDYPQMRELDQQFELGLQFFDPLDAVVTAEAMQNVRERTTVEAQATLGKIRDFTWRCWDDSMYKAIVETAGTSRRKISCL